MLSTGFCNLSLFPHWTIVSKKEKSNEDFGVERGGGVREEKVGDDSTEHPKKKKKNKEWKELISKMWLCALGK